MGQHVARLAALAAALVTGALVRGETMQITVPLNGDFEEVVPQDGGTLIPAGWQINDAFKGKGGCEAVEGGKTGKYALRVHADTGQFHAFTTAGWPVVRGTDASIRCVARGKGEFRFWLYCYGRNGDWVGDNLFLDPVKLTDEWAEFAFTVPIPDKPFPKGPVEVVKLAVILDQGAEVLLDGVSLQLAAPVGGAPVNPAVAGAAPAVDLELQLPPCLYAVPGLECNLYFENTVLAINPASLAFDVTCPKGLQQRERWTFTPKDTEVGEFPLALAVYGEGNRLLAQASTVVRVIDPAPTAELSVLIIGDSLTNASIYPLQVLENSTADANLEVRLIGTNLPRKDNPQLRHEGYGGWTAARFVSHYEAEAWKDGKRAGSPFMFAGDDGKPVFDYARYCREQNEGKAPDVATILLGCNDTFGATEETQADAIKACLANMDALVAGIRAFGPNTAIGILLPAPPAGTQDAFGANYGCGQTRWQYRRNQHRLVRAMMERYGGREAEGIALLPANVVVDPVYGFPSQTVKANARSTADVVRLSNGVHPNECGYRQIGDALYGWLKALAARRK